MSSSRMSYERFNQFAVLLLETWSTLAEDKEHPPSLSTEGLLEFIEEARVAHLGEAECLKGHPELERTQAILFEETVQLRRERDALRTELDTTRREVGVAKKKLDTFADWLSGKFFEALPGDEQQRVACARQWVMVCSPDANLLSWVTMAELLFKFRVSSVQTVNRWGLITGTYVERHGGA